MSIPKAKAHRVLVAAAAAIFLSACSALLIGESTPARAGIGASDRSPAQLRADNALAGAVGRALNADSMLRSGNVTVSARNGVVTLGGTVGSFDARDRAIQITSGFEGVSRVANQLQVKTR